MTGTDAEKPWIGVVVVAYAAADYIDQCLESLAASGWPRLKIVVVDNASPDDSAQVVRDWASGARPFRRPADWPTAPLDAPKPLRLVETGPEGPPGAALEDLGDVTLIGAGANLGFAGGVNLGLRALAARPEVGLFWVLNPDSVIAPDAPAAYAAAARAAGAFSLIGGRTLYYDRPDVVQSDGGRMRWPIGFAASVNIGAAAADATAPDPATLDFVSGANMVASRAFLDRVGLMDDSWFLYLEEVDWALRRGAMPLAVAPQATVFHRAGAAIGSRGADRLESPLSVYFSYRNHLRFIRRWRPAMLPTAYLAGLAMIGRNYVARGAVAQTVAGLLGLHGLGPPAAVRRRLDATVWDALAARRART